MAAYERVLTDLRKVLVLGGPATAPECRQHSCRLSAGKRPILAGLLGRTNGDAVILLREARCFHAYSYGFCRQLS